MSNISGFFPRNKTSVRSSRQSDADTEESGEEESSREITLHSLCGMAINKFGISSIDFYAASPREFDEALQSWMDDFRRNKEIDRVHTTLLYNITAAQFVKNGWKDPTELMPFHWDITPEIDNTPWTEENWKQFDAKALRDRTKMKESA